MAIDPWFHPELIDAAAWIAPGAVLTGHVALAAESSVWFSAVLRGDTERVVIGRRTNVQDGSIVHADPGFPCLIGDRVTLGHGAIVHGAHLADDVLIGMRAVVLNGAKIGSRSIVAAGALVAEGQEIPPDSLVMGVPGRVRRATTADDWRRILHAADHYVAAAAAYRQRFDQSPPPS